MTSYKRKAAVPPTEKGQRRSERYPMLVPVEVRWREPGGEAIKADSQAKDVNTHGGLLHFLDTETYPQEGTEVELTNLFSGEETRAHAITVRRSSEAAVIGVAVQLQVPSETFWGLSFRLRRATSELLNLDQAIKSGDIDPRVYATSVTRWIMFARQLGPF